MLIFPVIGLVAGAHRRRSRSIISPLGARSQSEFVSSLRRYLALFVRMYELRWKRRETQTVFRGDSNFIKGLRANTHISRWSNAARLWPRPKSATTIGTELS
jgi:hypothetical protein